MNLEERMAQLAARITDDDEAERVYASKWLDILWRLRERDEENLRRFGELP